jgi:hypothetical protein
MSYLRLFSYHCKSKRKVILIFIILLQIANIFYILSNADLSKKTALDNELPNLSESIETEVLVLNSKCECRAHQEILVTKNENHYFAYLTDTNLRTTQTLFSIEKHEFESMKFTCDIFSVFRRGLHQKALGYTLLGSNKFNYEKVKAIARQIKNFNPSWIMRVYVDSSVKKSFICELGCESDPSDGEFLDHVDFCNVKSLHLSFSDLLLNKQLNFGYVHGMMWRWFALGDAFVDYFASRDTDSFIIKRETDAVNEWMNSSTSVFHIMKGMII